MQPFTHLVVTAGISVLSERNLLGRRLRAAAGPLRFVERVQNPLLEPGFDEAAAIRHGRLLAGSPECSVAAAEKPCEVSAEFSLAHALRVAGLLHPSPRVVLLHTATLSGRVAAAAVGKLLETQFSASCHLREVADFDVSDRETLQAGLGAFMHKVVAELRGVDPSYACFAPQGGYKVMASLGYVAGSFLKFRTAYLHEDLQTLHVIPPIPMALLPGEEERLGRLARVVKKESDLALLSEDDRASVFEHPWLFEVTGGMVALNAFAEFLRLETTPLSLSPGARLSLREVHHARKVRRRLRELPMQAAKARQGSADYDGTLFHERVFDNLTRPDNRPSFHIWKADGGGVYAAWAEGPDGALLVNRLWFDHAQYEKDAREASPQSSRGLFDNPEVIAWAPLEPEEDDAAAAEEEEAVAPAGAGKAGSEAETVALNRRVKELNRENAAVRQRNAELRRKVEAQSLELASVKNQKSLLQGRVEDLQQELERALRADGEPA